MTPYHNNRKSIKWLLTLMALLGLAMLAIPFLLTPPAYLYLKLSDSMFSDSNLEGLQVTVVNNETGISHTTPIYKFDGNNLATVGKIASGKSSWQVKVEGYYPSEFTVDIPPLEKQSVPLDLKPAYGRLRIIPKNGVRPNEPIIGQLKITMDNKEISKNASEEIIISHLAPGNHKINVTTDEYYKITDKAATVTEGKTTDVQIDLIPLLKENEVARIVLHWQENPADLDSHLLLPEDKALSNNHVYFPTQFKEARMGNLLVAQLDVDDTSSYGPETTTIYKNLDGIYQYAIVHFAGTGSIGATSQAKVEVFTHNNDIQTFTAPANCTNKWWYVMDLQITGQNVQIIPKNQCDTGVKWKTGKKEQNE